MSTSPESMGPDSIEATGMRGWLTRYRPFIALVIAIALVVFLPRVIHHGEKPAESTAVGSGPAASGSEAAAVPGGTNETPTGAASPANASAGATGAPGASGGTGAGTAAGKAATGAA